MPLLSGYLGAHTGKDRRHQGLRKTAKIRLLIEWSLVRIQPEEPAEIIKQFGELENSKIGP
jgi:hypothetical protein